MYRGLSVLTYTSVDNGRGPGRTCSLILSALAAEGVKAHLFIPRASAAVDDAVTVTQALPWPLRRLPWRYFRTLGERRVRSAFLRALRRHDPRNTVVYIWPDATLDLVREAARRGFVVAREMINNPRLTAARILGPAHEDAGLRFTGISHRSAVEEVEELKQYDLVFSSNALVDQALVDIGVAPDAIRQTNFGWSPPKGWTPEAERPVAANKELKFLFVGTVEVRKGILDLLAAWEAANIEGELLLVGAVHPSVQAIVDDYSGRNRVRCLGYVNNPFELMTECDVFVFPTLEEGGPLVTLEAAGAGMAIIATPMGATRLVRDGETGIVVPPSQPQALAEAIRRLAQDPELRLGYGRAARRESAGYVYENAGRERARHMAELLWGADRVRDRASA